MSCTDVTDNTDQCAAIGDLHHAIAAGAMAASDVHADLAEIIHLMVGRELEEIYPDIPHQIGEPILEIKHLAGARRPNDASFTLRTPAAAVAV